MKKLTIGVLGLVALSLGACAPKQSAETTPAAPAEMPKFEAADTITAQVHVLAVDKANRMMTVKRDVGDTVMVEVGPEIKNFDQLAAGDVMDVVYVDKLTITVEPPSAPGAAASVTTSTANPGEKPAGTYSEKSEIRATITAIDSTMGTVTMTATDGSTLTARPQPENLAKVKVGDTVVFTHTQDVAVSVKAGAKKKKA